METVSLLPSYAEELISARLSSVVYKSTDESEKDHLERLLINTDTLGLEYIGSLNEESVQAYCFKGKGTIWIAIAGTNEEKDWHVNLTTELINVGGVNIHKGFHKSSQRLKKWVDEMKLSKKDRHYICGHSKAGAEATLLAYGLVTDFDPHNVRGVFTFGSPRVGDVKFVESYNKLLQKFTCRFQILGDPVAMVPTECKTKISGEYRHVSGELYFDRAGSPVFHNLEEHLWEEKSQRIGEHLKNFFSKDITWGHTFDVLGDVVGEYADNHSMDLYLIYVEKMYL